MTLQAVQGYDPRTGQPVGDPVPFTSPEEVTNVLRAAAEAFPAWSRWPAADRAVALEAVAALLDEHTEELAALADGETALGMTRLRGEVGRTTGQLRMFAGVLRDGGYVQAILTQADSALGRPDVRRMLRPLGPVAVFAASNFPFAFSVAGGDTASALAAGCPVVVKAHEGHPGTSLAVAGLVGRALREAGAPRGVFAMVSGFEAGTALARAEEIKAVGFTGSLRGGRALYDLTTRRPEPIPFYGELGSVNPVVVLPGAASARAERIAQEYAASLTLGGGQFCTNPGLLFVPEDEELLAALGRSVGGSSGAPMLTARIRRSYADQVSAMDEWSGLRTLAEGKPGEGSWAVAPRVWRTGLDAFESDAERLGEECFGPAGLVVVYGDVAALRTALKRLPGSLTASVHAEPADLAAAEQVGEVLSRRAGRLIHNGWPTGVAVCWAMHHGGPWPATTSSAHTSVGATAIDRWLAPVAYQDWPQELLPPQLRDGNPLGIPRTEGPR